MRQCPLGMAKINFDEKLTKFTDHWSPRVIAEMNDYQFKLVKLKGEFVWHNHAETECHVMLVEPRGVVNTGDAGGELTAENDVWV